MPDDFRPRLTLFAASPLDNDTSAADRGAPLPFAPPRMSAAEVAAKENAVIPVLWRGKATMAFWTFLAVACCVFYLTTLAQPQYSATARVAVPDTLSLEFGPVTTQRTDGLLDGSHWSSRSVERATDEVLHRVARALELSSDGSVTPLLAATPAPAQGDNDALPLWRPGLMRDAWAAWGSDASGPPRPEATLNALRNAVSVTASPDNRIIEISARSPEAKSAAVIANAVADGYVQTHAAALATRRTQAITSISDQLSRYADHLAALEVKLLDLRTKSGDLSIDSLRALQQDLADTNAKIAETQRNLAEARSYQAKLHALSAPTTAYASLTGTDAASMLQALEHTALALNVGERLRLAKSHAAVTRDIFLQQMALRRHESAVSALQSSVALYTQMLRYKLNLERDAEATKALHQSALERLENLRNGLQRDTETSVGAVLNVATTGTLEHPKGAISLIFSLVIGALFGAVLVLVRYYAGSGLRTREMIEAATGVPVIAKLPKLPAGDAKLLPYLQAHPNVPALESLRALRTKLVHAEAAPSSQVVMVTSSVPGEGKTTHALALTIAMASLGKRVLLIEGDIRRRSFTRFLRSRSTRGLASVLAMGTDFSDAVVHDEDLGVDVLFGDETRQSPADLFASFGFDRFISEVRAAYDLIVIDTPPVLSVLDAALIGRHAAALIYTVQWNETPSEQVVEGLDALRSLGLAITGITMSQIDLRQLRKLGLGTQYSPASRAASGLFA